MGGVECLADGGASRWRRTKEHETLTVQIREASLLRNVSPSAACPSPTRRRASARQPASGAARAPYARIRCGCGTKKRRCRAEMSNAALAVRRRGVGRQMRVRPDE